MKTITLILATLAVAIGLEVFTSGLQAASLPAKLPIGNWQEFINGIVTDRECYGSATIEYTNSAGVRKQYSKVVTPTKFVSYDQYQQYLVTQFSNGLIYLKMLVPADAMLNFYATLNYVDGVPGLVIVIKSIGTLETLALTDITKAVPGWAMASFVIPGMDSPPKISVDNGVQYSPVEPVYTDTLALYSWYSTGTNRLRVTLSSGGITNTYTQRGWPITPASIRQVDASTVGINTTPGSDAIIWVSDDNVNWQPFRNLDWLTNTGNTEITVDAQCPRRFYKVKVY